MNSALRALIRQTRAFIDNDPTTVTLIPRARSVTPTGAPTYTDGTPRQPQRFKLSVLSYDRRPTVTVNGIARQVDYHLIGMPDAQVELNDYWVHDGSRYDVVGFTDGHGYEIKAFVIRTMSPAEET